MTLHDLITSEPSLADAIASGNDGKIANWLNTPSVQRPRGIPINEFVGALYNSGAFVSIMQAAASGNATAAMAVTLIEKSKTLGIERIDMSLPVNQSLISALVSESIITQQQIDDVVNTLGVETVSPAVANGLGTVSLIDVAEWRLTNA